MPNTQAEHTLQTRDAYDRLAAVWASTTDEGPILIADTAILVDSATIAPTNVCRVILEHLRR